MAEPAPEPAAGTEEQQPPAPGPVRDAPAGLSSFGPDGADSGIGLTKAPEHQLKDSNVENIGSAEDKAARLAAAQTEREWDSAGQAVGIEIWRVENRRTENDTPDFGVKRWPKQQYGEFYKGDSYIILYTYKANEVTSSSI